MYHQTQLKQVDNLEKVAHSEKPSENCYFITPVALTPHDIWANRLIHFLFKG